MPALGRWTSVDPPADSFPSWSPYNYVRNDPVSHTDPLGLCSREDHWKNCPNDPPIESQMSNRRILVASATIATMGAASGAGAAAEGAGTGVTGGSIVQGAKIMLQTAKILRSAGMAELRAAAAAGRSAAVQIGGRTITYEAELPSSAMTNFAENSFHLGSKAFSSNTELAKTVLQELFRLTTGAGTGATGASAAAETNAAFTFAERAYKLGSKLGIW
jgi:uncharacterized protein RhaS with RHS repeats